MTRLAIPAERQASVCACGSHGFVPLTRGFVAMIDPEDVSAVADLSWRPLFVKRIIYARTASGGRTILMHRHLVGAGAEYVDHVDHDGLNNRRKNLRPCTLSQNLRNRRPMAGASCPFKGVHPTGHKFAAKIWIEGRNVGLGTFHDPVDAARAYDRAALEHFGAFAATNASLGLLPSAPA